MILSHHGQLEFGSPKLPQFPEALLLHYLDDLDSKMECMRAMIDNDRQVEGCFTSYNSAMGRTALKKDRLPERRPSSAAAGPGSGCPSPTEPAAAGAPPAPPAPVQCLAAAAGAASPVRSPIGIAVCR